MGKLPEGSLEQWQCMQAIDTLQAMIEAIHLHRYLVSLLEAVTLDGEGIGACSAASLIFIFGEESVPLSDIKGMRDLGRLVEMIFSLAHKKGYDCYDVRSLSEFNELMTNDSTVGALIIVASEYDNVGDHIVAIRRTWSEDQKEALFVVCDLNDKELLVEGGESLLADYYYQALKFESGERAIIGLASNGDGELSLGELL